MEEDEDRGKDRSPSNGHGIEIETFHIAASLNTRYAEGEGEGERERERERSGMQNNTNSICCSVMLWRLNYCIITTTATITIHTLYKICHKWKGIILGFRACPLLGVEAEIRKERRMNGVAENRKLEQIRCERGASVRVKMGEMWIGRERRRKHN